MQTKINSSKIKRLLKTVLPALTIGVAVNLFAASVAAQDTENIEKCRQNLQSKMSGQMGGNSPNVVIVDREVQVYQASNAENGYRGNGRYERDGNDTGRSFSFQCTVNIRNGDVRSSFRWRGGDNGGDSNGGGQTQTDPQQYAMDKCYEALKVRIGGDVGGNNPGVAVDARTVRMTQASNAENRLTGRGTYYPDQNAGERGKRNFTFTCTVNIRNDTATVNNYRFR